MKKIKWDQPSVQIFISDVGQSMALPSGFEMTPGKEVSVKKDSTSVRVRIVEATKGDEYIAEVVALEEGDCFPAGLTQGDVVAVDFKSIAAFWA